ncbi:hypothetical protein [Hymenobacter metallicola]|uniref:Uncharacterized protein n=1 Tax=Hymenobacter metallicola TaxID=2563114 RepID=A0A4Z0QL87_9BACT|nr:hypothetical protein [Hymenobacter metallicola]TGE29811.1 hypothetical protein E5K02_10230 [Hymenobacter metallicola]
MEAFFDKVNDEISKCQERIYPIPNGWGLLCLLPEEEYRAVMRQFNRFMAVYIDYATVQIPGGFDFANITSFVIRGVNIRLVVADVPKGFITHTISVE